MKGKQAVWFPHIMEAIPIEARKNQISMYTIALEGWRRGLKLKFYSLKEESQNYIRYSLSNGERIHHFNGSSGDKVTQEAFDICENKNLTSQYLYKAGVPIPLGSTFYEETSDQEIMNLASQLAYPLVVKPIDGKAGRGVIANIKTKEELKDSLQYVRGKLGYKDIIVQQYVAGEEVRVYVLDGRVLGAANRRPANVIGDGEHSIKELIQYKNELRKKIPHLHFKPIQIDREIKLMIEAIGYTPDSIPKMGELILLRKISNISRGGDPIDFTDYLTDEQKQTAINATNAIPGLLHCGVDMILDEISEKAVVLELNTRPGIGSHLFPLEGKARDISKAIIDLYFPETKKRVTSNSNVFFDFGSIQRALKGSSTTEIEVSPFLSARLNAKRYKIESDVEGKEYYLWLKGYALKNQIHGSVKKINNGCFELIVAGDNVEAINNFREVWENNRRFNISVKHTEVWYHPVKLGFEWEDGYNSLPTRELEDLLKEKEKELKQVQKETERIRKINVKMKKSNSWKVTFPLRLLSDGLRKIKHF